MTAVVAPAMVLLMIPARVQPGTVRTCQTTPQPQHKLPKPSDPEAAALLIHLIERYARNVPNKTVLDRALELKLGSTSSSRATALRLAAKFRAIPLNERRAVLGAWADLTPETSVPVSQYQTAFKRLASSAGKPPQFSTAPDDTHPIGPQPPLNEKHRKRDSTARLPGGESVRHAVLRRPGTGPQDAPSAPPGPEGRMDGATRSVHLAALQATRYRLSYEGLYCHYETASDQATSPFDDEIYILTSVIDANGSNWMTRHPRPYDQGWYVRLDDGDTRTGPRRYCWGGAEGQPAQELTLTVTVFERDTGDPEDAQDAMEIAWTAAGVVCEATNVTLAACLVSVGVAVLVSAIAGIFMGGEDDLVEVQTRTITANQIRTWDNTDPRMRGNIPYHFSTIHINDDGNAAGADYHVYFRITSPLPFG
jgi:hypothetical protein